jgi:hypothetical protein
MIFVFTLPGVSLGNVAYKWLVAGVWGSALTSGITDTTEFDTFVISSVPPDGAQEILAYDVTDESNRARGDYLLRTISGGASVDDIAARIIADHGAGSYVATGGGTGAYTVTVTVTDEDDNPLQNATVRVSDGVTPATGMTDVNGNAVFGLDAATYTVAVTKAGYSFTPTTRTVTGDESGTLTDDLVMARVVPPEPSAPNQSVGSLTTFDGQGNVLGNVTIYFRIKSAATDSFRNAPFAVASGDNGVLNGEFQRNSDYEGKRTTSRLELRNDDDWIAFTVPDADSFDLPAVLGNP